jgi:serine/threonine-protein kinase
VPSGSPAELRPGTVVAGRYTVLEQLGSGSTASVWAARDEQLRRTVAIKKLNAGSVEAGRRFQREARLGAGMHHPNLVVVHDVLVDGKQVLLVMEYVEGRSLDALLRAGPVPRDTALDVLDQTARAIDHAHSRGVIHRDVKPGNILVGDDGRVLLADLGIATAAGATRITTAGALLGTPAYMAPERIDGSASGPAGDVYALATVAYELIGGKPAHTGRNAIEVIMAVVRDPAPDVRKLWPEAPAPVVAALQRGMARSPADRPESAGAFVTALRAAFSGG